MEESWTSLFVSGNWRTPLLFCIYIYIYIYMATVCMAAWYSSCILVFEYVRSSFTIRNSPWKYKICCCRCCCIDGRSYTRWHRRHSQSSLSFRTFYYILYTPCNVQCRCEIRTAANSVIQSHRRKHWKNSVHLFLMCDEWAFIVFWDDLRSHGT